MSSPPLLNYGKRSHRERRSIGRAQRSAWSFTAAQSDISFFGRLLRPRWSNP